MRLTLINQFYPPDISPTASLCASLAEHRARLGDDVTVVTSRSGYLGQLSPTFTADKVRVRRLWTTCLGSRSIFRRLIDWGTFYIADLFRMATLPRQDVIISLTTPPYIALAAVLHRFFHPRTRLILWNMDTYPEALERTGMIKPGGMVSWMLRAINRFIFRRLDRIVCLDFAMVELLSQYMPPYREPDIRVIANWENAQLFDSDQVVPPSNSPLVSLLANHFVVLYTGNAGYGHEFETIIAAAKQLQSEPVIFLFVGGGSRRQWLLEQRALHHLGNILLCDYVPVDQIYSVLKIADCALITLETQMAGVMSPSKLHLNLAASLPILYIGPPHTNVDEAISDFNCGISLRPGQVEQAVDFIQSLRQNPQRKAALRQCSRSAFNTSYNDERALACFDEVIEEMMVDE